MAKLGDCATILQLAFGLNAIGPAIGIAYRNTQESLVRRFANDIKRLAPQYAIDENDMPEFVDLMIELNPGRQVMQRLGRYVQTFSLLSLGAAFLGLLFAATSPEVIVSNGWVWLFAIVCVIVSPGVAVLYRTSLRSDERAAGELWSRDEKMAIKTGKVFKEKMEAKRANQVDPKTEMRQLQTEIDLGLELLNDRPIARKFMEALRGHDSQT